MAAWVVRAGYAKDGWYEPIAFGRAVAVIDFGLERDISEFASQQVVRDHLLAHAHPRYRYTSIQKAAAAASQLWRFVYAIMPDDMVIIARTGIGAIAVGRVQEGIPYHLHVEGEDACFYVRPVDWKAIDVPRSNFDPVLLDGLNIPRTVFRPNIADAETQIEKVLSDYLNS